LEPITARPVTPIWAVPMEFSDELMEAFRFGCGTVSSGSDGFGIG
jgi:hypothetical protein